MVHINVFWNARITMAKTGSTGLVLLVSKSLVLSVCRINLISVPDVINFQYLMTRNVDDLVWKENISVKIQRQDKGFVICVLRTV